MRFSDLFKKTLGDRITDVIVSGKERESLFEDIEEQLILADISLYLTERILNLARKKLGSAFRKEEFMKILKDEIVSVLKNLNKSIVPDDSIFPLAELNLIRKKNSPDIKQIIFLVGVNGSGKTTTAAKLGYKYSILKKKVILAATDTFRAAGGSQLTKWGEKLDIPVISGEKGADPGSVLFNALNSFKVKDYDILIVDTAGRVQTKENLMRELEKLVKIVKKFEIKGPSDIFLVVDSTMGQNTVDQAKKFREFAGISGIILAKIDGTAKGGTILRIADELGIPVKYVGTGENEGDLEDFSIEDFVSSLVGE